MPEVSLDCTDLRGVNFTFPTSAIQACRDVDLTIAPGEIRALIGENGAGKTTLSRIFAGTQRPNSGSLYYRGQHVNLSTRSPGGSFPEIGMVRQQSIWAPSLRVWENAALGRRGGRFPRGKRGWIGCLDKVIKHYNLKVDSHALTRKLDATALQRAEIAAALVGNPRILIVDEPALIGEGEVAPFDYRSLFSRLKDEGRSVLIVSHRLFYVLGIADTITIMRSGSVVATLPAKETNPHHMTSLMFDQSLGDKRTHKVVQQRQTRDSPKKTCLQFEGISMKMGSHFILKDLSFSVQSGEILGILGLREEGVAALEDLLSGVSSPDEGAIYLKGERLSLINPVQLRRAGLAYVPTDRINRGSSLSSTIADNLLLHNASKLSPRGWLPSSRIVQWAKERQKEGNLVGRPEQLLEELSGGNIQKVILERELRLNPQLLVIAEPTLALDERFRWKLYDRLRKLRDEDSAIVLLTTDLDEALTLADRVAVMFQGQLSPIRPATHWSREELVQGITGEQI